VPTGSGIDEPAYPLGGGPATERWLSRLLVEKSRPRWVRDHRHAPWLIVGAVCVGAFMGQLDASIVTLALPSMQRSFGVTISQVEWVALAYLLTLVGLVTAVGRVADMVGRKSLYTYGFAVFTLASMACAVAPTLPLLVAARVVQGGGAALLQANSVALISTAVPRHLLGRGIGVQGAAQALGLALGPAVGGFLVALGGWTLIFWVNVPIGVVGFVMGWLLLPRSRHLATRVPMDRKGLALLLPASAVTMLGLSMAARYPLPVTWVVSALAAGGVLFGLFMRWQVRAPAPLIDPGLFRRPAFTAGIVSGLLSYLVLFGVLFVVPYLLEGTGLAGPARAGLVLTALPVSLGLAAPFAGVLADRIGARTPTVAGMVVAATALGVLAVLHGSLVVLAAGLAVVGAGLGAFTPSNNAAIMASAPHHQAGVASGVLNMTRGMGTALGVAIAGLVFTVSSRHAVLDGSAASAVGHGFTVVMLTLCVLASLAALLAALRGGRGDSGESSTERP
jgi:EmrB/QacA subfamily drug resistance transporter